ncbi:MAG: lipoprotein [Paracoccaceae bacterium]
MKPLLLVVALAALLGCGVKGDPLAGAPQLEAQLAAP